MNFLKKFTDLVVYKPLEVMARYEGLLLAPEKFGQGLFALWTKTGLFMPFFAIQALSVVIKVTLKKKILSHLVRV